MILLVCVSSCSACTADVKQTKLRDDHDLDVNGAFSSVLLLSTEVLDYEKRLGLGRMAYRRLPPRGRSHGSDDSEHMFAEVASYQPERHSCKLRNEMKGAHHPSR